MPRVAPIAPAEIRQASPAPQRNGGSDPFSRLLNATAGDDRGSDAPPAKNEPAPEPRHAGHAPVSRASHRRESAHSDRHDAPKSDAPQSGKTDTKTDTASPQKDAASAGDGVDKQGGDVKQSKKDKRASDETAAAAVILPAADTVVQVALNVNPDAAAAVVAAPPAIAPASDTGTAVPAPAAGAAPVNAAAAADTPAAPPVEDLPGDIPVAADKAATDKTSAVQTSAAGGLMMSAAKAAAGAKMESAAKAGETTGKDAKADPASVAPDAPKPETGAKPTTAAAGAMIAAKLVSSVPAQHGNAAPDHNDAAAKAANPAADPKPGIAANVTAAPGAMADAARAAGRDGIETIPGQHVSADVQSSNAGQIVLPDAARSFASTLHAAGAQAYPQSAANNGPAVPLAGAAIAVAIAARSRDGSNEFQIRLDPPELGRIDVKLDVDKNGQVNTHLTADRQETLDLLQRDARGLERALQQAGLKTGSGGLEFSLRQQTPDGSRNGHAPSPTPHATPAIEETVRAAARIEHHQWTARLRGGVDIRV